MQTLTIRLRTRTPLWTGGIDGSMDRIHETGLLGSLRWWYEAIVRGLGGWACDPSRHTCSFDAEKYRKSTASDERQRLRDAGLCDACQVFGATGWKRRFRLEVRTLEGEFDVTEGMFPSGRIHSNRVGGWLLRGGYHGELELKLTGDKEVLWCEILPVLLFVEKWGALGAKTSLGYGVFEILSINGHHKEAGQCWRELLRENKGIPPLDFQQCSSRIGQWWWVGKLSSSNQYQGILPALTNMFFAKVRFSPDDSNWWEQFKEVQWINQDKIPQSEAIRTDHKKQTPKDFYKIPNKLSFDRLQHWAEYHATFPISPILRTRLRYGPHSVCKGNGESDWCKFVFGTVKKNRIQSKIRISWAYQINDQEWEIRLWGWIPEDKNHHMRTSLLQNMRDVFGVNISEAHHQWHPTQNAQLWKDLHLPNPEICWYEIKSDESPETYLQELLNCDCKKSAS